MNKIICQQCYTSFEPPKMGRRRPKYCSNACRQRAYRVRKKRELVTSIDDKRNATGGGSQ